MANGLGGDLEVVPIATLEALNDLKAVVGLDTALEQPEAVVEPHIVSTRGTFGARSKRRLGVLYPGTPFSRAPGHGHGGPVGGSSTGRDFGAGGAGKLMKAVRTRAYESPV